MSVLSHLYGRAAQLRRAWYARHPETRRRLTQPVISVGNLVVGGSGKTPVVCALARLLHDAGERPAILSRGYGRKSSPGVVVVSDGDRVLEPVARSGDEPQLLARALHGVPVLVCADRYDAGRLAEERFGATVHLLDDGFQHLRLARDVELLLMTAADLEDRVLPAGRLREPIEAAGAADALLVAGTEDEAAALARSVGLEQSFAITWHYQPLRAVGVAKEGGVPQQGRAVAVAGIARPARFFSALRERGWDLTRTMTFRDHHWFSAGDLDAIEQAARDDGADVIVTTEKDAMRLDAARDASPVPWLYLPIEARIDPSFFPWLAARLSAARAA